MKSLLLTKSNLRKSRGISIGITLLMLMVSLLLSATLIILFDFLSDVDRQKERLNAKDSTVLVGRNVEGLDDEFFLTTLTNDVEGLSLSRGIAVQYAVKYGSGTVTQEQHTIFGSFLLNNFPPSNNFSFNLSKKISL